jgi:L-aminopeptidase/D-esterase-like protein
MQVLPEGFRVGHWTNVNSVTGCTVILCPPKCVGGCEVRGSSPGSREISLLASDKTMQEVHALVLAGGSAYGLAAADGVMKYLEEREIGYQTPWVRVPIVPAAVIFDLNIGSRSVRPDAESGYMACEAAETGELIQGTVGVGTGATVGKWAGWDTWMKGGFGVSMHSRGSLVVSAVAVVNAVGDVLEESGKILAGARSHEGRWLAELDPYRSFARSTPILTANTTLVAILTNARLSKVEANRLAQRAHNGMARAIKPVHTSFDGDAAFGLVSGLVEASFDLVAEMGADAVSEAIRSGIRNATSLEGVSAYRDVNPGT